MSLTRSLPMLNMCMWLTQCGLSLTYAHSWPLAILGAIGTAIAFMQYRAETSR